MKDENVTYAYMYRRISSWNQVGNNSLNAQKEAIMQYAEEHNIKIVGDYVDSAKSGTTTKNRTAWLKMLSDMDKNPQVTEVVTHYLNRTARNARDLLNTSYDLALKGKSIITTDGLDTLNPEHREKILDAAAEAEKYSLLLKRETMKGLKVNAEKMLHNGGTPPYGYVVGPDKKLHIDLAKEPAVKAIFEKYAAGLSYDKIIEWLDANGYKTAKGETFSKTSIKSILENEKYCGNYFWNKRSGKDFRCMRNSHKLKDESERYHVIGGVPAIVSVELFNKVQERLRDNKSKIRNHNGKNFYPMNGKIFCSKCGAPLKGKVQYSKTNKNGEPVKQYKFSCDCFTPKSVNEKYLDDMIVYGLRECIFSPVNIEELLQRLNVYSEAQNDRIDLQITLLNAEKADVEKRRKNLVDVVARGESIPSIITEIGNMDEQIKKIDYRISEYETSKKVFTLDDLRLIKDMFTGYVREECNEDTLTFLNDTIDRIEVGDDVTVKLKKNIKVDRDTKKIFTD